jgi:hypothetical protein
LQSLIELTQNYPEIWGNDAQKLIFVCSDVMKTANFELATRQTALEIVSTLAEGNPTLVRQQKDNLKDNFLPALFLMMTQVENEDDEAAWAAKAEEEILGKDDSASIAAEALDRIASILGEKTMMACSSALIFQAVNNQDSW